MKVIILPLVFFVAATIAVYSAMTTFAYPLKYKDEITAAGKEFDVCPALIASVVKAESKFKPDAVSHVGAVGLMQIMPTTAEYIAKLMPIENYDLENPVDNIRMGTFYLRYLLNRFPDTRTAIMAYNAGEGNVKRWLAENPELYLERTPYAETNAYVDRVFNAMNYYKNRF